MKSGHEKSLQILRYPGMAQYYAYEETKGKAEEAIVMDMIKEMEPVKDRTDYSFLPFYTIYQTKLNKKEKYSAIAAWTMHFEKEEHPCQGDYLLTLVDCYEGLSEEIFEHRRAVRDMARSTLQRILNKHKGKDSWQKETSLENYRIAYAIWKACYLHMILPDIYLKKAQKALEAAKAQQENAELSDAEKQEIALILNGMENYDPYTGGWEVLHDC